LPDHFAEIGFRMETDLDQLQRLRCQLCRDKASVSIYELRTKRSVVLCAACAGYSVTTCRGRK
jgi:hypothetical protein